MNELDRLTSRNTVQVSPRRAQHRVHIRDLSLHQLERTDRNSELFSFVNIGNGRLQIVFNSAQRVELEEVSGRSNIRRKQLASDPEDLRRERFVRDPIPT